jgi:hypothetical protein
MNIAVKNKYKGKTLRQLGTSGIASNFGSAKVKIGIPIEV